jgi:hypothetical protein
MDGDDQVRVIERHHDAAALTRDESTVARGAVLIEILSETIRDNGFGFLSGPL